MISFFVQGIPAPQGSKRFVGIHQGKGRMIESSKKVKPWREAVYWAAIEAKQKSAMVEPMDGPLRAVMIFGLPRPATVKRRCCADRKPDLDKLVRSTCDALVNAGIIVDDSRIVSCLSGKTYPNISFVLPSGRIFLDVPGAFIQIKSEGVHDDPDAI